MANAIVDNFSKDELEQIVKSSFSLAEVIDKLGYTTHHGNNNKTVKNRIEKYGISVEHFTSNINQEKRNFDNIFCEGSTASQQTLRRWYLKNEYSEYKCAICNNPPLWCNKPLTLILDHINGINNDNRLENLRWVCPNCNQQLGTTGFKIMRTENKNKKEYLCTKCGEKISRQNKSGMCQKCYVESIKNENIPSREELKNLIRNTPFTTIGKTFNVSDRTIIRWCSKYNLPERKKDINSYSDEEWEKI